MEVAPRFSQDPQTLKDVYISTSGGSATGTQTHQCGGRHRRPRRRRRARSTRSPPMWCATRPPTRSGPPARASPRPARRGVRPARETMIPLATRRPVRAGRDAARWSTTRASLVASTISFNLPPGVSLSTAATTIENTMHAINMPASIYGGFAGSAKIFQRGAAPASSYLDPRGAGDDLHLARHAL